MNQQPPRPQPPADSPATDDDDDDCPMLIDAKVPVVVLTGFLGSGKTTLLQYILTQDHGLKIAVIVNEFEFGRSIEKGLTMRSSEKEDDEWLELNNGCLCCTAKTQTVLALENLIARQGSLDLILIETSGMADPAPIAATFWQDDALQSAIFLAGIITVVDSVHIVDYLDTAKYREASQQLLVADKIIFNKVDLIDGGKDGDAMRSIVDRVATINPVADREFTEFSRISNLRTILSMNTTASDVAAYLDEKRRAVDQASESHGHTTDITSMHFEIVGKVMRSKRSVDELMAKLVFVDEDSSEDDCEEDGESSKPKATVEKGHNNNSFSRRDDRTLIIRAKAAVWVAEDGLDKPPQLYQIQSIGQLFDVVPMHSSATIPALTSRFLILGKRLTPAIEAATDAAFVHPRRASDDDR